MAHKHVFYASHARIVLYFTRQPSGSISYVSSPVLLRVLVRSQPCMNGANHMLEKANNARKEQDARLMTTTCWIGGAMDI